MTRDVNRDRLERLRGDLAELRARAVAAGDIAPPAAVGEPSTHETAPVTVPPVAASTNGHVPSVGQTHTQRATSVPHDPDVRQLSAHAVARREGQRSAEAPRRLGRRRIPRPRRRNPFRRRAHRPPRRLAVPTPVPVARRSAYLAGPRYPTNTVQAAAVLLLVGLPVVWQMAFRLWTAMNDTSFLLGADPTRAESLRAAAGVAGGGITMALAVAALGIVRGRIGYLGATLAVGVLFIAFPYLAYTANADIVSAPLPGLQQLITPDGWPRTAQLHACFLLAAGALATSIADLGYRSIQALRAGIMQSRRR